MNQLSASSEDDSILSQAFARDRSADPAADAQPKSTETPEETAKQIEPKGADAEAETTDADVEGRAAQQPRDPKTQRFVASVPLATLKETESKYKERLAETERLREEAERRAAQYEQMIARFQQPSHAQQQFQQPAPQAQTPPDLFENPAGFVEHLQGQFSQQLLAVQRQAQMDALEQRADFSEHIARQRHGDETVDRAVALLDAEARRNPKQGAGYYQHFLTQRDPFGALVDWYTKNATLAEIGADPKAYREKIKQELLAELKGGAPAGAASATAAPAQTRFPTSLAAATASGKTQSALVTDEAIMSRAFGRG